MRPVTFVLLSGCLTFGVPLLLALRELLVLRRGRGGWFPGGELPPELRPKPLPPRLRGKVPPAAPPGISRLLLARPVPPAPTERPRVPARVD